MKRMVARPDFFIVGAPKSATTALVSYLAGHPEIHIAEGESHYFATDFGKLRLVKNLAYYESLFTSHRHGVRSRGEKSVWYMYSSQAIEMIRRYNPEARLIVMLRDPSDMIFSLHGQFLYLQSENESDFARAWALCAARKAGMGVSRICKAREVLFYDEVARYGDQMERIYALFPKELVHIIFYDDFSANPSLVYGKTLDFLGLAPQNRKDFPVVNSRKAVRSKLVQHTLLWASHHAYRARMELQFQAGLNLRPLWRAFRPGFRKLVQWNTRQEARSMPPKLRRMVQEHYLTDIKKLSRIVGRDLSGWATS